MKRASVIVRGSLITALLCSAPAWSADPGAGRTGPREDAVALNIKAQSLGDALNEFARQTGLQVVLFASVGSGITTSGLTGDYAPRKALEKLLAHTGLRFEYVNDRTIAIRTAKSEGAQTAAPGAEEMRLAAVTAAGPEEQTMATADEATGARGTPEILVKGRRTVNADIQRTEDDAQPYVVFGRAQIQRSMATNLEEFLKTRLPMNTVQGTQAQAGGANLSGNQSSINLRGLGLNQTLILVDGRRLPGVNTGGGDFGQPDVNGIPLPAIERIEVLPSTASGIYGGGATGGVINIITRQDYTGVDVNLAYGNTFDSDVATRRVDASAGLNFENGRTRVLLSASHADSNPLLVGERSFSLRGRALQFANNPNSFYTPATPPAGRTSNIRSQNGQPLTLKAQYGGQSLGSPRTHLPAGYRGASLDGAGGLIANAGRYNLELPDDTFGARQTLMNSPTVQSAALNLRRSFGSRVEAFADLNWLDNRGRNRVAGLTTAVVLPASAPNNPFTGNITVRFPSPGLFLPLDVESETMRATGGFIVRLPHQWTASADYLWSRSSILSTMALPALGDPDGAGPGMAYATALSTGVLDVMRDLNALPMDFTPYRMPDASYRLGPSRAGLRQANLRTSGPLLDLPAGPVILSALAERRDGRTEDTFEDLLDADANSSNTYIPGATQKVDAFYVEARFPLVSARNERRGLRALELQASARHDRYTTHSPSPSFEFVPSRQGPLPALTYSTNRVTDLSCTLGLRYSPAEDLTLRASLGTGFLPPGLDQITTTPGFASLNFADPKRGNVQGTYGPFDYDLGGNPDLEPEDSRSWSAGVILTPRFLPALRLSLDYTNIDKSREIAEFTPQLLMDLENLFPGRVRRAPLEQADANLGYTGGVIEYLDLTAENFAATRLEAWDLQTDYGWQTASGSRFDFFMVATWQPHFERQALPDEPFIDSVGFNNGQLEWRGNAGLTWEREGWMLGWSAQYYAAYKVYTATAATPAINTAILSQGGATIPSQLYHDAFLRYRFDAGAGVMTRVLANSELLVGVQNALDKEPPVLATTGAVGGYSLYGDPRLRRYSISLRRTF